MEKYGFVYLWYDKKNKRYYVGCHWGTEDDGYICSSNWMRKSFSRRPQDFKRRILKRIYTNRKDTFIAEDFYLGQIKDSELKHRYYNVSNKPKEHWSGDNEKYKKISLKASVSHWSKTRTPEEVQEIKDKISKAGKGKKRSEEFKKMVSETSRGRKHSDETKQKISEAHKGKVFSEERREKCATYGMLGKKHSEETKEKMRLGQANRILSDEAYQRMTKGHKHTEETKKKISESQKGIKRSDEFKAKISKASKGRKMSDETKEKLRQANLGKKRSPEARAAMSRARLKYLKENT